MGLIRDPVESFPEHVSHIAWTKELDSYYKESQIYLHPSLHEGMPNSVLEALGLGLITLVADTAELRELVSSAELTFNTGDPETLAKLLLEIQGSSALFSKLQELSIERAQELHFDWDEKARLIAVN